MTTQSPKIAVLFTSRSSHYVSMPGLDLWPIDRDARQYPGPHPVIAHPPCGKWGNYAGGRGKGGRLGDDAGCGVSAVGAVRMFGGVLEHPANSRLWDAAWLPPPGYFDHFGGYTVCISQRAFGHRAILKPTWLYCCGLNMLPPQPYYAVEARPMVPVEMMGKAERERTPKNLCRWLVDSVRASCRFR